MREEAGDKMRGFFVENVQIACHPEWFSLTETEKWLSHIKFFKGQL